MLLDKEALRYHREPRPGKIEVVPTKPTLSQADLSLGLHPRCGLSLPCNSPKPGRPPMSIPPAATWWASSPMARRFSVWAISDHWRENR